MKSRFVALALVAAVCAGSSAFLPHGWRHLACALGLLICALVSFVVARAACAPSLPLRLDRIPTISLLDIVVALLWPPLAPHELVRFSATVDRVVFTAAEMAAFASLCAGTDSRVDDATRPPALFVQVQLMPLMTALLIHPRFPLDLLGAVHVRNHAVVLGELACDRPYRAVVALAPAMRAVARGAEFDVVTRLFNARDDLVFESTFTALAMGALTGAGERVAPRAVVDPSLDARPLGSFDAAPGAPRAYARLTGDFNPIHTVRAIARALGYRDVVVHALWALSRALVVLEADGALRCAESHGFGCARFEVAAAFRRPIVVRTLLRLVETDAAATAPLLPARRLLAGSDRAFALVADEPMGAKAMQLFAVRFE